MKKSAAFLFQHLANVATIGGGSVYAWTKYSGFREGEIGSVANTWAHDFHLLSVPLLVFGVGLLWTSHAFTQIRQAERSGRRSGIALLATFIPMVLSGYVLQVVIEDEWRTLWVAAHLVFSGLWTVGYLAHLFRKDRR